jgi:hypothetical protein
MVREQLEASSGHVRCGHCMVVFDASIALDPASLDLPSTEKTHHDELSFVQLAQKEAFWSNQSVRIGLILITLLLLSLLLLQVIRLGQERLVQLAPNLEPVAQHLCALWPCTKAARLQIDGWRIESSNFQKEGTQAFRLTVQLKNISQAQLLVPQLEISLLDTSDAVLVRRALTVAENQSIPSGEERTYYFLITPQSSLYTSILGYRLVLFYP